MLELSERLNKYIFKKIEKFHQKFGIHEQSYIEILELGKNAFIGLTADFLTEIQKTL